jgi:hypothetical protein
MGLVERGSLDDLIEQQTRLPEEQVLEAGIQTAKGLRAAYAKCLVHGDVKPANILFGDDINELRIDDAAKSLDGFLNAQLSGKFAWIAELKPLAQKYLDDCRLYLAWKSQKPAALPDKKQLKTRSAISDAIFGKEKQIASSTPTASQPLRQLTQKEIETASQKRAQWLVAWKKKLIDDLNRK